MTLPQSRDFIGLPVCCGWAEYQRRIRPRVEAVRAQFGHLAGRRINAVTFGRRQFILRVGSEQLVLETEGDAVTWRSGTMPMPVPDDDLRSGCTLSWPHTPGRRKPVRKRMTARRRAQRMKNLRQRQHDHESFWPRRAIARRCVGRVIRGFHPDRISLSITFAGTHSALRLTTLIEQTGMRPSPLLWWGEDDAGLTRHSLDLARRAAS